MHPSWNSHLLEPDSVYEGYIMVELYIMVGRTLLWRCWASPKEDEVISAMNE